MGVVPESSVTRVGLLVSFCGLSGLVYFPGTANSGGEVHFPPSCARKNDSFLFNTPGEFFYFNVILIRRRSL